MNNNRYTEQAAKDKAKTLSLSDCRFIQVLNMGSGEFMLSYYCSDRSIGYYKQGKFTQLNGESR